MFRRGNRGLGLFCRTGGGGFVGGLESLSAAGLESEEFAVRFVERTLRAGLIPVEAVEDDHMTLVGEIAAGTARDFDLEAAEALKIPGSLEDFIEENGFHGSLRV